MSLLLFGCACYSSTFLQVATILRNLSFEKDNVDIFGENKLLLRYVVYDQCDDKS